MKQLNIKHVGIIKRVKIWRERELERVLSAQRNKLVARRMI